MRKIVCKTKKLFDDIFKCTRNGYSILGKTNGEYWVLNPEGDLVHRSSSLSDVTSYIRMQDGRYA